MAFLFLFLCFDGLQHGEALDKFLTKVDGSPERCVAQSEQHLRGPAALAWVKRGSLELARKNHIKLKARKTSPFQFRSPLKGSLLLIECAQLFARFRRTTNCSHVDGPIRPRFVEIVGIYRDKSGRCGGGFGRCSGVAMGKSSRNAMRCVASNRFAL